MGRIIVLDEDTSNKIAAGEVIDRPASAVKELVENSIDAGAKNIIVEIAGGGISLIRVTDNGHGFLEDDVEIAFERHSTSKIRTSDNLNSITTLGFRGEALASIASVSRLQLVSRAKEAEYGMELFIEGGRVASLKKCGTQQGTIVTVKELFYNTPARYKFLKKDNTEARYVSDIITKIALGNPGISFILISNGSELIRTPGNGDLLSTIFSLYGKDIANHCIRIEGESGSGKIEGYVGAPEIARANRTNQSFYVNGRFIKNSTISAGLDEAFRTFTMKNRYPFAVLNISINPEIVDVNVHPTKQQVKFSDEQEIFRLVYHSVRNALTGLSQITEEGGSARPNDSPAGMFGKSTGGNAGAEYGLGYPGQKSKRNYTGNYTDNFQTDLQSSKFTRIDYDIFNMKKVSVTEPEPGYRIDVHKLKDMKISGHIFKTYIILEVDSTVVLIDQHAAHERIMYERIKKSFEQNEIISQPLLEPAVIKLTIRETQVLNEKKEMLSRLGFNIDNFGNNSIILRTVPYDDRQKDARKVLMDLLDYFLANEDIGTEKLVDEAIYKIACTSAIKANHSLADAEIQSMLNDLCGLENPYNCPHGRPIMIVLSKEDIERLFKRRA